MYTTIEVQSNVSKLAMYFDDPVGLVASESGKSRPTVSKFFKGEKVRPSSKQAIFEACIKLIDQKEKELKSKEQDRQNTNDLPQQTSLDI